MAVNQQPGLKVILWLKVSWAFQINQAPVSQLASRNAMQGHKGELSNAEHDSFILHPLPFIPLFIVLLFRRPACAEPVPHSAHF